MIIEVSINIGGVSKMSESILSIKLKEYRIANSLTQQELAEILDVSDKSISKWELGNTYPSKKNIIKISELLDISMELLLLEEVVEEKQKENSITKYLIPALIAAVFVMTVFNFLSLQTIKQQNSELALKEKKIERQQIELDKLYDYTVTLVLAPKTPYTDFKEYLEKEFNIKDEIHIFNESDYIIMSFNIQAHNNGEMEFLFQEIKREAPGLTNSEYHSVP